MASPNLKKLGKKSRKRGKTMKRGKEGENGSKVGKMGKILFIFFTTMGLVQVYVGAVKNTSNIFTVSINSLLKT